MLQRLVFGVVTMMHAICLGAAGGDDMPMTLWQQADLCEAIHVVALPDVIVQPVVTKTNVVWNTEARSLTVRAAVIMHPDNQVAEIFACHVAAADSFLFSPWRKQACSEIKALQSSNSAQAQQQDDAIRPAVLASITIMRTKDHAWPRYQIYTETLRRITRCAFTMHDEQPEQDLLCITPEGAQCFSQSPSVKELIAKGESSRVENGWLNLLFANKLLGIRLNYKILNDAYNELFPAPVAQE